MKPISDGPDALQISADRLFDGTGAAALSRPILRTHGETIAEIGQQPAPPSAGPSLHFPGCTILPGLIDTHVHLVFIPAESNDEVLARVVRESDDQLLANALANARAALRAGLTTVRDCGGRNRVVQEVRDRIRRGEAEGPDVLACGMPITTRTGHCHWLGLIADTQDEVMRAGERMLAEGADFLKVMATGGNMTPSSDPLRAQYDAPTLGRLADLGRAAGKHTAAHVLSRAGMPGAVAARIQTIEHCDWRVEENRYEFDPELARRMIDQGQYVGFTMTGITRRAFRPLFSQAATGPAKRLDIRFECERRTIEFGVPFTLHSDAGVRLTPIDTFAEALRAGVIELRLTPAEAIRAATATAAAAIGLSDRGRLAPGLRADLLIVEGNPLEDITCLERVRAVIKAGKFVLDSGLTAPNESGYNTSAQASARNNRN